MTETPNPNIVDTDSLTGEMHPIRRVVLALGSNLGERLASLQGAVDALADTPDFFVTGVSPVYETDPVDSPEGSGPYLNAVLLADTTLPAARLMERALAVEDAFERERSEVRNAPAHPRRRPDRRRRPSLQRGLPAPAAPARPRARVRPPAVARPRARRRLPRPRPDRRPARRDRLLGRAQARGHRARRRMTPQ